MRCVPAVGNWLAPCEHSIGSEENQMMNQDGNNVLRIRKLIEVTAFAWGLSSDAAQRCGKRFASGGRIGATIVWHGTSTRTSRLEPGGGYLRGGRGFACHEHRCCGDHRSRVALGKAE